MPLPRRECQQAREFTRGNLVRDGEAQLSLNSGHHEGGRRSERAAGIDTAARLAEERLGVETEREVEEEAEAEAAAEEEEAPGRGEGDFFRESHLSSRRANT
jgi:hypothetical protein